MSNLGLIELSHCKTLLWDLLHLMVLELLLHGMWFMVHWFCHARGSSQIWHARLQTANVKNIVRKVQIIWYDL